MMLPWVIAFIQILGILSAIRAVMDARTPQGAIAWAIALIAFPYLALPLFWIFGKRKFEGYVIERRSALSEASPIAKQAYQALIDRGALVSYGRRPCKPFSDQLSQSQEDRHRGRPPRMGRWSQRRRRIPRTRPEGRLLARHAPPCARSSRASRADRVPGRLALGGR